MADPGKTLGNPLNTKYFLNGKILFYDIFNENKPYFDL